MSDEAAGNRYSAAMIAETERPRPFTFPGRFGFTCVPRPVSAPVMLRMHAAVSSGSAQALLIAMAGVLRAAFPKCWWRPFWRDPVWRIMRLSPEAREFTLRLLFRIPGSMQDATRELTPTEQLRQMQREAVHGKRNARGPIPTLATASIYVRAHLSDSWYFAPQRWQTVDGYAPFTQVWLEYFALETVNARERLNHIDAALIATGGKDAKRAYDATLRAAFPGDAPPPLVS